MKRWCLWPTVLLLGGCVSITHIHVAHSDDVRTHVGWPGTRIIVEGGSIGAVIDHQAVGPTLLRWDGGFTSSLLASRTQLTTAPRQHCLALITGPLNPMWVPPKGLCAPLTFY